MSGTFPTTIKPKEIELDSEQEIAKSTSESKKSQSRPVGGHLWLLDITYPIMTYEQFAPMFGFSAKQRGESFQVKIPPYTNANGTIAGTALLKSNASKDEDSFIIDGVTNGTTFLAGDFFTMNADKKSYMLTEDAIASGGEMTVNFTPPLIADYLANASLKYDDVAFTMEFEEDIIPMKLTRLFHANFQIKLKESIYNV